MSGSYERVFVFAWSGFVGDGRFLRGCGRLLGDTVVREVFEALVTLEYEVCEVVCRCRFLRRRFRLCGGAGFLGAFFGEEVVQVVDVGDWFFVCCSCERFVRRFGRGWFGQRRGVFVEVAGERFLLARSSCGERGFPA